MTSAKLKPNPSDGHGLTSALCERYYQARQRGEPVNDIVAVAVLRPVGTGEYDTAKGTHRHVQWEAIRLEPASADQVSALRMAVEDAYVNRTSNGTRTLPLDFGDLSQRERCAQLIEAIDAWSDANNLTEGQLRESWHDHHGIGHGGTADGNYRKASLTHLLDFAHKVGAVRDEVQGDDVEPSDDDTGDDTSDEA